MRNIDQAARAPRKAENRRRIRRADKNALDWLHERRTPEGRPIISDDEYKAGVRLREDYTRAQMQPRVTASWNGLPDDRRRRGAPGHGLELRDAVIAAQQRVRRALRAVGADHAGILVDVCCVEIGLAHVERREGWPQRSAKVVLQIALRALAEHYGMSERRVPERAEMRHWAVEDYRGSIDEWRAGS